MSFSSSTSINVIANLISLSTSVNAVRPTRTSLDVQNNQPAKKKGIFMDEAITITISQCDMKLSASEKGILSAVSFFGIICSSHLLGYLADTKGHRCVIQPTLFLAFLLSVASSFVENFYLIALRSK